MGKRLCLYKGKKAEHNCTSHPVCLPHSVQTPLCPRPLPAPHAQCTPRPPCSSPMLSYRRALHITSPAQSAQPKTVTLKLLHFLRLLLLSRLPQEAFSDQPSRNSYLGPPLALSCSLLPLQHCHHLKLYHLFICELVKAGTWTVFCHLISNPCDVA